MKKTILTNSQRRQLCIHKDKNPKLTQDELGCWAAKSFNLVEKPTQATVSRILSKRKYYLAIRNEATLNNKRQRQLVSPQVDEALANWVFQCQTMQIALTGELIREKAKRFAELLG